MLGKDQLIEGPTPQVRPMLLLRSDSCIAAPPYSPTSRTVGYRSAVDTPISAVAAARRRSAWRTSGRRLMRADPSPTGINATMAGGVTHASTSLGASIGVRQAERRL